MAKSQTAGNGGADAKFADGAAHQPHTHLEQWRVALRRRLRAQQRLPARDSAPTPDKVAQVALRRSMRGGTAVVRITS